MLVNLVELNLAYTKLSGELPSELGNLANIEELFLSQNEIEWRDTSSYGQLSQPESILSVWQPDERADSGWNWAS